ncbi:class I SAM-dependent methyltransferase [Microlunatus soli]|uniref:Methyltransferase domain-containing protein n=1 Tax=Microlunatus soli TaxID=630515 RepID=A0A1H1YX30_9ACTN|nr:class I SAM-dependent methyltransferase [Microlunatus soli]SDT25897.1 Methyltransferase domain-containing protein [Microlunatus soli]
MNDQRPALGQLRRDAKRLLTSARDGDRDALDRIGPAGAEHRLADAQLAIAREHGYPSWPRLVRDLETMTPTTYAAVDWRRIDRVTICCFSADGQLIMADESDGHRIARGAVYSGEDPLLDAGLRIPLQELGFRRQGTHVVAISDDRRHALFWVDGYPYTGDRPHATVPLWHGPADRAGSLLRAQGDGALADWVELADEHRRTITDAELAADSRRLLDASYLRSGTVEGGSGFGGSPADWRAAREQICDVIEADVSFLDIGCANGLLMESVVAWSAERGHLVEPYGVDHSAALVDLARRRLPQWQQRIWIGDALTWQHPDRMRFDVVAVLTDIVHQRRHRELIKHLLDNVVAPDGRLLLNSYSGDPDLSAVNVLRRTGYPVDGETSRPARGRPDDQPSAWTLNRRH